MHKRPIHVGFTLIELLIAVAIVGILASMAYPSYTEHVRSGRRADAQGALYGLQQALERYFTTNSSFAGAVIGSAEGTIYPDQSPVSGGAPAYTLQIIDLTATSYTLRAVPTGVQTNDKCGILSLTSTNIRGIVNPPVASLTTDDCWRN